MNINNKITSFSAFFSMLISLISVLGNALYKTNDFTVYYSSGERILTNILAFIFIFSIVFFLSKRIYIIILRCNSSDKPCKLSAFLKTKKGFIVCWLTIFTLYLPCFLAYYPGIYSYDIVGQNTQVETGIYTAHHPPIHTFIWGLCVNISEHINVSPIEIYSISQMLLLSFCSAKMLVYISSKNVPKWLLAATFIFVAVNPVYAICSLLPIKDVFCACFLILMSISILILIENPKQFLLSKKNGFKLMIEMLGFCLFRNNAIYAVVVSTPIMLFCFRKSFKKVLEILMSLILVYCLITVVLYGALGIKKGSKAEMLSVPIQQISFVLKNHSDEIDDDTLSIISKFLPYDIEEIIQTYNPRFADPIKGKISLEYGIKPIAISWMRLAIKYPIDYMSSFMTLNLPYWYFFQTMPDEFSGRLYIETYAPAMPTDSYRKSILPDLLKFYEKIANCEGVFNEPPFVYFFSLAIPFICLVFFICMSFIKGNNSCCFYVIPLLFWMTYLLGPVSNFRYLIPLYAILPLIFAEGICLNKNKPQNSDLFGTP